MCRLPRVEDVLDELDVVPHQLQVDELLGLAPPGGFGPETAVFGIVGRPVEHSWSPLLQGMAMKAKHLDAVYLAFEPESLEAFLRLADDENFRGFSVTLDWLFRLLLNG